MIALQYLKVKVKKLKLECKSKKYSAHQVARCVIKQSTPDPPVRISQQQYYSSFEITYTQLLVCNLLFLYSKLTPTEKNSWGLSPKGSYNLR